MRVQHLTVLTALGEVGISHEPRFAKSSSLFIVYRGPAAAITACAAMGQGCPAAASTTVVLVRAVQLTALRSLQPIIVDGEHGTFPS